MERVFQANGQDRKGKKRTEQDARMTLIITCPKCKKKGTECECMKEEIKTDTDIWNECNRKLVIASDEPDREWILYSIFQQLQKKLEETEKEVLSYKYQKNPFENKIDNVVNVLKEYDKQLKEAKEEIKRLKR